VCSRQFDRAVEIVQRLDGFYDQDRLKCLDSSVPVVCIILDLYRLAMKRNSPCTGAPILRLQVIIG